MADENPMRTPERAKNLVRQKSMKTVESLYAEPPPNYSPTSPIQASVADVASGSTHSTTPVFDENFDFGQSPLQLPIFAECITHLKLLHAFAKLRYDVGNYDGVFGIHMKKLDRKVQMDWNNDASRTDNQQPEHTNGEEDVNAIAADYVTDSRNTLLAERIRDKRWTVFVTKAVDRYAKWWSAMPSFNKTAPRIWSSRITMKDFDSTQAGDRLVSKFPVEGDGLDMYMNSCLPPLDVLMVWHSHMLNPRAYLEDCIRYSRHALWRTSFPWQLIHDAIDNDSFGYHPNDLHTFTKMTGHTWDSIKDETPKKVICPRCISINKVPWTNPITTTTAEAMESYLDSDTGFSSPAFEHRCFSCELVITHEKLKVSKFISDADDVLIKERPLPGTILDMWGTPQCTSEGKHIETHDPFFPNRVVQHSDLFQPKILRKNVEMLTLNSLKIQFEDLIRSRESIRIINTGQKRPEFLARGSKVAIRMMMSHYWENSSGFGLDLVGAVLRQGTFTQKMWKLNWLHSPGVMATIQRAIVKYHRFVRLSADNPRKPVVPTLDIDLAWHTHQLTPNVYYEYTLAETKKFLNHDDKIPESNLNTAFKWTSRAYEEKYGQPYSECSCWYCECTREPMRSHLLSKLTSRRSSLSVKRLEEKNLPKDPHLGPHVSSHNAISFTDGGSAQEKRRELENLDHLYAKVCKRYQKKKDSKPPERNVALMYGAYGMPIYPIYPVYVPAYADGGPGTSGSSGAGCAVGTCSMGASLGSCAGGDGTPGCAASCGGHGDAAGGCGSCSGDGGGGGGCGGCGGS